MRHLLVICLLFFASSALAATDIVATYKYQDGKMVTIVTRDQTHVRMDTSPTSYLLLQDDKVLSVSKDDNNQWMMMDMGQIMAAKSGGFASLFGGGDTAAKKEYQANYEKTSQKEKIAGYSGVVYNVEVLEDGTVVRRDEVVLSTHSDLKKVNEGWSAIVAKMSDIMGEEMAKSIEKVTKEAKKSGYGGMLRYGDEMTLHSLKKMSLDVSYYQVPPGAQYVNMGQMPAIQQPGKQPQLPDQKQLQEVQQLQVAQQQTISKKPQQDQSQAGKVIKEDAKDVGQAARQETKDATIDEVKEGVRTLFKSIFD